MPKHPKKKMPNEITALWDMFTKPLKSGQGSDTKNAEAQRQLKKVKKGGG